MHGCDLRPGIELTLPLFEPSTFSKFPKRFERSLRTSIHPLRHVSSQRQIVMIVMSDPNHLITPPLDR